LDEAINGGASAMIGYINNYPWETHDYYVPYNAVEKGIPGVWVSPKNGKKISNKNLMVYAVFSALNLLILLDY